MFEATLSLFTRAVSLQTGLSDGQLGPVFSLLLLPCLLGHLGNVGSAGQRVLHSSGKAAGRWLHPFKLGTSTVLHLSTEFLYARLPARLPAPCNSVSRDLVYPPLCDASLV